MALNDAGEMDATLRAALVDVLGLPHDRVAAFGGSTPLFGAVPEFDAARAAAVLAALRERLGILVGDDKVEAERFETYGDLLAFIESKALG